jgi:Arc/MetJ-type ribon-helix-helix transcriptional regulator
LPLEAFCAAKSEAARHAEGPAGGAGGPPPPEPVRRRGFATTLFLSAPGGWGLGPRPRFVDFSSLGRHLPFMADKPTSLAEPAREWIAQRVASGAWPDADAYLNDLVERDRQDAEKQAAFNAAIEKGFASGFVEMSIEEVFAGIRQRHSNAA